MARCDAGYFCHVCGLYVDDVTVSELYLRYVMRQVPLKGLYTAPDAHVWCNPALAQFITDPEYVVDPMFHPLREVHPDLAKARLSPDDRERQEKFVTMAWRRLQQIPELGITIQEYPLAEPDVPRQREENRWSSRSTD
jgi:hypothetical protein